jgi:hypothetical protein
MKPTIKRSNNSTRHLFPPEQSISPFNGFLQTLSPGNNSAQSSPHPAGGLEGKVHEIIAAYLLADDDNQEDTENSPRLANRSPPRSPPRSPARSPPRSPKNVNPSAGAAGDHIDSLQRKIDLILSSENVPGQSFSPPISPPRSPKNNNPSDQQQQQQSKKKQRESIASALPAALKNLVISPTSNNNNKSPIANPSTPSIAPIPPPRDRSVKGIELTSYSPLEDDPMPPATATAAAAGREKRRGSVSPQQLSPRMKRISLPSSPPPREQQQAEEGGEEEGEVAYSQPQYLPNLSGNKASGRKQHQKAVEYIQSHDKALRSSPSPRRQREAGGDSQQQQPENAVGGSSPAVISMPFNPFHFIPFSPFSFPLRSPAPQQQQQQQQAPGDLPTADIPAAPAVVASSKSSQSHRHHHGKPARISFD